MPELGEIMTQPVSSVRVRYEPLRSLGFAGISGTYAPVGLKFDNPVRILKVSNLTNANLKVSFDAVTDMDIAAANGYYLYDFGTNKSDAGGQFEQPAGNVFYVKSETGNPTSGTFYVTVIYASAI